MAGRWWQALGEPELDTLIERALAGNPDLAVARQRLLAARQLHTGVARSAYQPQIALRSGAVGTPDSRSGWAELGFDAHWELGLFGRAEASELQADAELQLVEVELAQARLSLVAELARGWLAWRHGLASLAAATEAAAAERRQLQRLQGRLELGLAAEAQLTAQRARLNTAEQRAEQALDALPLLRQRLAILLGDRAATLPEPSAAPARPPPALDGVPTAWLADHPALRRAEQQLRQAAAAAGMAEAERWPRLALGGTLGLAVPVLGRKAGDSPVPLAALGPLIDFPLFDAGRRSAIAAARRTELDAALLAQRQAVLEAQAEVEAALLRLRHSQARSAAAAAALAGLDAQDRMLAQRVALGLASPLQQAEGAEARHAGLAQWLDAGLAQQLAFIAVFKALGSVPPAVAGEPG